jgi:hypothetical protein
MEASHAFVKRDVLANLANESLWKRLIAALDGVREFIDRRSAKTAIHLDKLGIARYNLRTIITRNFTIFLFAVPAIFITPIVSRPKCPEVVIWPLLVGAHHTPGIRGIRKTTQDAFDIKFGHFVVEITHNIVIKGYIHGDHVVVEPVSAMGQTRCPVTLDIALCNDCYSWVVASPSGLEQFRRIVARIVFVNNDGAHTKYVAYLDERLYIVLDIWRNIARRADDCRRVF